MRRRRSEVGRDTVKQLGGRVWHGPRMQATSGAFIDLEQALTRQDAAKAEKSGAERRLSERVLVDLEVDYATDETYLFAYIADISTMGIFVRTTSPEPAGTRLNLRFGPRGSSSDDLLELEGVVIWVNAFRQGSVDNRECGMGIQFVDLAPEQRERLRHLVRTFAVLSDDDDAT